MKATWEINKLENVCEIISDKPEQFTGTNKYYTTRGINNECNYKYELVDYLTRPGRANLMPKIGDVGFAKMKGTNKVFIVNKALGGSIFSTGFSFLRAKKNVSPEYLFSFIASDEFQKIKDNLSGEGIMGGIKKSDIGNIEIPVPPTSEQKRIVKILDEAFEKVTKAKENAEKNLQNARKLFEAYLQNIFTNPNGEYEEKRLGEVYDVRDGTHDSPKYQNAGFALITSKNLKKDKINYDKIRYISENDYKKINQRSKVHKGDILFAMIGTIGNPVVVEIDPDFAIKNVALFKVPNNQSNYFLKYYLDSKTVIDKMMSEAKGTTQKFVGLGYLRSFKIKIPSFSKQQTIVAKLDNLSVETKKLETIYQQKLTDLEELKKSVLQKAFRGEL